WHLSERSTPVDRGFSEFYGMLDGFNTYWQEEPYQTRLPAGHPKRTYPKDGYYSTNAFGDYALDFLQDGGKSDKPWFMYLSFNAGHFPLHAPEAEIAKYEALYRTKGWDAIRTERLARQKKMGLVPPDTKLPPSEPIPPNFINVQTGWANKPVPAWDTLDEDRRADLGRRMATYAATVDIMDQNIGRVVDHLKKTGQMDNTIIFFLSDNGGCAEWDPYGFDKLDSPNNILHKGAALKEIGAPSSYISYGTGWASASDTPWRLYKHYTEEGGIRTPMIVHWPKGLKAKAGSLTKQVGFLTDFMPTLVELCGATYPKERNGVDILPTEGVSMVPVMQGKAAKARTLCVEHEGNRMVREGDWKLVAVREKPWGLFDLSKDPTELNDLSAREPARAKQMETTWNEWAIRCNVIAKPSAQSVPTPEIAGKRLVIRCEVQPKANGSSGVILA
ncbi:MAG: arylsulfatase, partial [Alphaproteobacteria bacterium]